MRMALALSRHVAERLPLVISNPEVQAVTFARESASKSMTWQTLVPTDGFPAVVRWEQKASRRYYEVRVTVDLLGHTILTRSWGSIGEPSATTKGNPLPAHAVAAALNKVAADRDRLGYLLVRSC